MFKSLSACLLAGSVALATTSAPATAGTSDFEKFLLGATTLVIIGSALSNSKKRTHTTKRVVTTQPRYSNQSGHGCYKHRHHANGHAHYHGNC